MKLLGLGVVLAVLGVAGVMFALVNHSQHLLSGNHGSVIIGVVGLVLLVLGAGIVVVDQRRLPL
jgi:hypothetical protein